MPKTLITGSLAYDYVMQFGDVFSNHILPDKLDILNISFTAHKMDRYFGGTAGNIAYAFKLLQEKPVIFTTVGKDFGEYATWFAENGIDTSNIHVHKDIWTASAHIITDAKQNQLTAFYGGAMLKNDISLAPILNKYEIRLAIIAADGRDGMLRHAQELKAEKIPCIYDPGHSLPSFNKNELLTLLKGSFMLIVNDYEEDLFCSKTQLSRKQVLEEVQYLIVTRKEQGSIIYSKTDKIHIPAVQVEKVVDPTGAGDVYRAGILKGLLHRLPIEVCSRIASTAACYKVESAGTQGYHYSIAAFKERYYQAYGHFREIDNIFEMQ